MLSGCSLIGTAVSAAAKALPYLFLLADADGTSGPGLTPAPAGGGAPPAIAPGIRDSGVEELRLALLEFRQFDRSLPPAEPTLRERMATRTAPTLDVVAIHVTPDAGEAELVARFRDFEATRGQVVSILADGSDLAGNPEAERRRRDLEADGIRFDADGPLARPALANHLE